MVGITFTDQALDDLDQIAEYIAQDSEKYAALFINRIFLKVSVLKEHPRLGRKVPEFDSSDLRELIYGHYRIVYNIVKGQGHNIEIISVHHSAKKLSEDSLFG